MKMLHVPLLVLGVLISAQSFAATAQQEKMTTCNAQASEKAPQGRRAQGLHEYLSQSQARHPAGKDENLQRRCQRQGAQGRRAQSLHERLPEEEMTCAYVCLAKAGRLRLFPVVRR